MLMVIAIDGQASARVLRDSGRGAGAGMVIEKWPELMGHVPRVAMAARAVNPGAGGAGNYGAYRGAGLPGEYTGRTYRMRPLWTQGR